MSTVDTNRNNFDNKEFKYRVDFYYIYVSIYAIALIIYAFLKGTIDENKFSIALFDPVVILLLVFILVSVFSLFIKVYKRRIIIIGKDSITFKSRFRNKTYNLSDITRISFGRHRLRQIPLVYRIIKIKLKNRRRTLRIRPTAYWNEKELLSSLTALKNKMSKLK